MWVWNVERQVFNEHFSEGRLNLHGFGQRMTIRLAAVEIWPILTSEVLFRQKTTPPTPTL